MVELDEVVGMDLKVSADPVLELARRKEVIVRVLLVSLSTGLSHLDCPQLPAHSSREFPKPPEPSAKSDSQNLIPHQQLTDSLTPLRHTSRKVINKVGASSSQENQKLINYYTVLIGFSDAVYTAYKKIVNYLEVVITLSYFQIINSNTLNKS